MQHLRRNVVLCISLVGLGLCVAVSAQAADIVAASCSTSNVMTAVNTATHGDSVLIPNGSCTWTSGIATTKRIIIRAQNYTPTAGGDTTRNVVLTNNASGPLFNFTTGNDFHAGLAGIRINEGTGTNNAVEVNGSGSKVFLMADMYFEVKQRNGTSVDVSVIDWPAQGGVIWNTRFVGLAAGTLDGVGPDGAAFVIKGNPRVWNTASTMGSLDTNGDVNVYMEDSSCLNVGQFPDLDDHGRAVFRHSDFDGCWGGTHAFTSAWGGRHIEYYDNTFNVTDALRNISGRYYWIRAGTSLFTTNVVNDAFAPQNYGNINLFSIGDNTPPGSYPMARQPGWGHNGTIDVIDPIYAWNNTGARNDDWGYQDQPGGWENIVLEGREVFVEAGAKPGYSKYTYPHQARQALEAGGVPPTITITTNCGSGAGNNCSVTSTPQALAGTAADSDGTLVSVTVACTPSCGSPSVSGLGSWSTSIPLSTGANVVTVTATDDDSLTGQDSITITYTPPGSTPPTVTITAPTSGTTHSTSTSPLTTLAGTAADSDGTVASVAWSCNANGSGAGTCGSGAATGTTSWSVASITLTAGQNVITVTATDNNSNTGSDTLTVTYSPTATTYYIDQTAGNDSNPGTEAQPWQRAPGMTAYSGSGTLNAGDTVYFDRGDTWTLSSGTQGIHLVGGVTYIGDAWGTGTKAILRATINFDGSVVRFADHATLPTIFKGFDVDANSTSSNGIGFNHQFCGDLDGATKRAQNNIVRNVASQQDLGQFAYGIIASNHNGAGCSTANVEILENVVHDISRDGIALYPGDEDDDIIISNILVRGNEVYNTGTDPEYCCGAGLGVKGRVVDAILEYNYVHNTKGATVFFNGNENDHYGIGMEDIHLRYNIIDTPQQPNQGNIRIFDTDVGDPKEIFIYGNLVLANNVLGGLTNESNVNDLTLVVYNNTFVGSFVNFTETGDNATITFTNNIIYYTAGVPFSAAAGVVTSHTNNVYFRGSSTLVDIGGTTYTAATLSTYEATGISADPLFVNVMQEPTGFTGTVGTYSPNTPSLGLQANSPARNAGATVGSPYNNSVNSLSRPQGSAYDIGAYEMGIANAIPVILRVVR